MRFVDLVLLPLTVVQCMSEKSLSESFLTQKLLQNYDKVQRPVLDPNDAVTVKMGLALQQIIHVVRGKGGKNQCSFGSCYVIKKSRNILVALKYCTLRLLLSLLNFRRSMYVHRTRSMN